MVKAIVLVRGTLAKATMEPGVHLSDVARQLGDEDVAEALELEIRLRELTLHHCIGRRREEDFLDQHVAQVGQQSDQRHDHKHDPGLAVRENLKVLAVDLRLENLSDTVGVSSNDAEVVEGQAGQVDQAHQPVPVGCLDEELNGDDVHDQREGDSTCEPVRLGHTSRVYWARHAL